MKIGSLIESNDTRVAISLQSAKKYIENGYSVFLEHGYAKDLYDKHEFEKLGVVFCDKKELFDCDIFLQVLIPKKEDYLCFKNCILICFLNPFFEFEHLDILKANNVTCFSMELVPRSSIAQKMDALSSQASLAGYASVTLAASKLNKVFPMMVTPAGTIRPTKVLVIGTGVAGLQAIATAKRLGALVSAYDTRVVAKEQVESLGAKFLMLDLNSQEQTDQGYAQQLTAQQLQKQRELLETACIQSDVIITTAQVFSKKAPVILTTQLLAKLKEGTVIVDCAVDSGGNVENVKNNKDYIQDKVFIIAYSHLAQQVCFHASEVYSKNILEFILECFSKTDEDLQIKFDHEIVQSMLVINNKEIIHPLILEKRKT